MIITVATGKGGTGKTTTAIGLASIWAEQHNVLLADLDPQESGSATWWLDHANPTNLTWTKTSGQQLKQTPTTNYDIVVIDTPPRLDGHDLPTAAALSDLVVVIASPSALDISTAAQTIAVISPTNYLVCLTKVDPRSLSEAHEGHAELLALGHPVSPTVVRLYAAVRRSAPILLPTELQGTQGTNHRTDIQALAHHIETLKGNPSWRNSTSDK